MPKHRSRPTVEQLIKEMQDDPLDLRERSADFIAGTLELAEIIGSEELKHDIQTNLVAGLWPLPGHLIVLEQIEKGSISWITIQTIVKQAARDADRYIANTKPVGSLVQ